MNIQELQFEIYVAIHKAGLSGVPIDKVLNDLQELEPTDFITKYLL